MGIIEQIWAEREDIIYPELFGPMGEGIYPLSSELFMKGFGQKEVNLNWLNYGVVVSSPNASRNSWLYVSSGLSNPWSEEAPEDQDEAYSGIGVEFVLETPEEANWGIGLLQQMMAYHLLVVFGHKEEVPAFAYHDLIRLGHTVDFSENSLLRNLMITKPEHYRDSFKVASGHADFFHFLGITDAEYHFGKEKGKEALYELLKNANSHHSTDPNRACVVNPNSGMN